MKRKVCTKCGVDKELSEFNKKKRSNDGLQYNCRECQKVGKKNIKNIWGSLTESDCSKCGLTKVISDFYEYSITICKECKKENSKNYRMGFSVNGEYIGNTIDEWKQNNSKKIKDYRDEWKRNNPEKVSEYKKKWYNKNKDRVKISVRENSKIRKKTDPFYRSIINIRKRTKKYLKLVGIKKDNSMFDIIGCTPDEFRKYLESKFLDGMTWNNYGLLGWHIDHIIPLSTAKNKKEIYKLSHYSNLQPLWAEDNLRKSNKILN